MGSGITRLLSSSQGSELSHHEHTVKKSLITIFFRVVRFLSIEFPGRRTFPILASGWGQFLSCELFEKNMVSYS